MASNAPDETGFLAPDLTDGSEAVPPDLGGSVGGALSSATGGLLGGLGNLTSDIGGVLKLIEHVIPAVIQVVGKEGATATLQLVDLLAPNLGKLGNLIDRGAHDSVYKWMTELSKDTFMLPLLRDGLGIEPPGDDTQAGKGLKLIDSMVAFAVTAEFIVAAVSHGGKAILGNRWPEALGETIGKIPEVMGLSWALGLVIDGSFEAAFGESLNNYIRSKTRPNRPEWMIARQMLKQKVITDDQLTEILQDAGFEDRWIAAIRALETTPLPVGDIQAAYQSGIIESGGIDPLLTALGFSDDNRKLLKELYITKAETAAGAEIRSVYRQLYRDGLVGKGEYEATLEKIHFPHRLIQDDIAAADAERTYGWRMQSVGVIKSSYLHNPGSQSTAVTKLQAIGYSHDDAVEMVNSWTAPAVRRTHGLTEGQVLKFLVAGVLQPEQARTQLMALGLDANAADFLISHPMAGSGSHVVRLTPALVTQAYVSGALKQDELRDALQRAGATGDALDYLYRVALYKYAHQHKSAAGNAALDKAEILEAYKYGIYDPQQTLVALEGMGYAEDLATVLLEIINRGPFRPAGPAPFKDVSAALAYLISLGITFQAPPSPQYEAALQMVEMAGYIPQFPQGFKPPTAGGEGGGGSPIHPLPPAPLPTQP